MSQPPWLTSVTAEFVLGEGDEYKVIQHNFVFRPMDGDHFGHEWLWQYHIQKSCVTVQNELRNRYPDPMFQPHLVTHPDDTT